ncbi:MAG: hypothetical protein QW338_02080, partial [Conexivisphaerales archaeon]
GDEIRSVKTVAQNNEMRAKIIGYNAARIVDMASSLFGGFLQSRLFFEHFSCERPLQVLDAFR